MYKNIITYGYLKDGRTITKVHSDPKGFTIEQVKEIDEANIECFGIGKSSIKIWND